MTKKIISMLVMAAMLFSMILFSSCKEEVKNEESKEKVIELTPKEKFLKTGSTSESYFAGLTKSLGIDTKMATVTDGKMESGSFGIKLNKLSVGGQSYITEPVSISVEAYSDIKSKVSKALGKIEMGGEKVPFEMILSTGAMYFSIDKVTERMVKVPMDNTQSSGIDESSILQASVKANEYLDYFMDSLNDDLFTVQNGKVTVDGTEIADAETITMKATVKQFDEAIIKLLEKAKTDAQIADLLSKFTAAGSNSSDNSVDSFKKAIEKEIESLNKDISEVKDGDNVTINVINENGSLRSFELIFAENGKKNTISLTTTVKDNVYNVKGSISVDGNNVLYLKYQQKPNDKGSADGELTMNVDGSKASDESEAVSKSSSSVAPATGDSLDNFGLSFRFSGKKTDNKVSADSKLEFSTNQSGMKVTIPINITFNYEKVSDTENKFDINMSANVMGSEFDITLNGGTKIVDYAAIKVPADDEVDKFDKNMDTTKLLTKVMEVYPGIQKFIMGFAPTGEDGAVPDLGDF